MSDILKVTDLTKKYANSKVLAVNKVSFEIGEGEIFALIGSNGAGKTTTIRMIATLIQATEGDAEVCGYSIRKNPEKVREQITYLPDEAGAYKSMKGIDYLKFMAGLFTTDGKKLNEYVQRAIDICKLGDRLNDKILSYSRGMIRKLLLARAVMTEPKLAVINALEIRKTIKQLARENKTSFLLSSHNMLEIEYVSDRVGIISHGNLMVTGTTEELKKRYEADNLEEVFERVVISDEIR